MAPPQNPGDANNSNDDPLGGMDPMAWLESLAARQGANPDELTTAADLDIPVLPADTVVDEPGYTPGYDMPKSAAPKAPEPAAPPPPQPEPVAQAASDDPLGGMDPMAWLESLAARQGANADELTTAANLDIPVLPADTYIDEPGYTPGYDMPKSAAPKEPEPAAPPPPPQPEPVAQTPEPVAQAPEPDFGSGFDFEAATSEPVAQAASDDPLGGMDPMAWLESLAARQGANPDELTTAADLDIPVLPSDTFVDEPGYIDYDPFGGSGVGRSTSEPAAQPSNTQPTPEPAVTEEPVTEDALSWLSSLAGQSDTDTDDFMANLGAGSDSATQFGGFDEPITPMSAEEAAALLGLDPMPASTEAASDPLGGMDPLSWLESLAANQGGDFDNLLDLDTEAEDEPAVPADIDFSSFTTSTQPSATSQPESDSSFLEDLALSQTGPLRNPASTDQVEALDKEEPAYEEAGGMSNDISEVQAWLESQARNLEQIREEEDDAVESDVLAPAEPGSDLPDWLRASMPSTGAPASSGTPALRSDIAPPPSPSELPDWLVSPESQPLGDLEKELLNEIRDTGTMPAVQVESQDDLLESLSDEELEALTRPSSPEEVDSWAEALDEEYERKAAGDESVPDWYMEALARAEAEAPRGQTGPLQSPIAADAAETVEAAAAPVMPSDSDMPDWLRESVDVEEAASILPGDVPDWLLSMSPETAAPAVPASDWLSIGESSETAEQEDLPDWLSATEPEPAAPTPAPTPAPVPPVPAPAARTPEPTPVAPPPAPAPAPAAPSRPAEPVRPVAPVPAGAASPEHVATLQTARELVANNNHPASLEHYQRLIDASQLLEEARGDLRQLVEQTPGDPRVRRLLGDTHMRLGDLQAALDSYRSALNQL